jgi:hypothetical protein
VQALAAIELHNRDNAAIKRSVLLLMRKALGIAILQREENDTPETERTLERTACAVLGAGLLAMVARGIAAQAPTDETDEDDSYLECLNLLTLVLTMRQVRTAI